MLNISTFSGVFFFFLPTVAMSFNPSHTLFFLGIVSHAQLGTGVSFLVYI